MATKVVTRKPARAGKGRKVAVDALELDDMRGQLAAISKAQAVIEFDLDGTIRTANENFLKVLGYTLEEVRGHHHSMFVEPGYRDSAEYRAFWAKLGRGEYDAAQYKRIGKGGREVWIQASYNPIMDANGKPFKVVKYATDITAQMARNADYEGQLAAISKAQAVIEFDLDGTIRTANPNFLNAMGYTLEEVRGRHHSMFVEPGYRDSAEYRAFWAKLGRGEYDAAQYKRIGKGGREVWIQASYNPIMDANGKPFKVVKYATEVTAQVLQAQMMQTAVLETQEAVKFAVAGDLTRQIPLQGKTGQVEALCQSVNALLGTISGLIEEVNVVIERGKQRDLTARIDTSGKQGAFGTLSGGINALIDNMMSVVRQIKSAATEVQQGAEEISKGNTNLSQRTEEQASSLEETASSMEQMTSTVKQNADNAAQANQLAMAARQQAEKGGTVVGSCRRRDGRHQLGLEEDRRHHQRHRRDRLPDQSAGAQRRGRGGAGRRAGPRLCGRRDRGAQPGRPQRHGSQGDQGADPGQRGQGGPGQQAGRRVGPHARGDRRGGEEGHRHRGRDRRGEPRAVHGHRAGQQGRDADG